MPELTDAVVTNSSPEMSSIIENLQKHALNSQSRQNVINASTSSVKETSSSSQQVNNKIIGISFVICIALILPKHAYLCHVIIKSIVCICLIPLIVHRAP